MQRIVRFKYLNVQALQLTCQRSDSIIRGVCEDIACDLAHGARFRSLNTLYLAFEYPLRWFHLPSSREFSTRLSNFDVVHTLLSYPAAVTRFWTGHGFDILKSCVRRWEARLRSKDATASDITDQSRGSGTVKRMIDEQPRPGSHYMQIAFVHSKSCFGVRTELCEPADQH